MCQQRGIGGRKQGKANSQLHVHYKEVCVKWSESIEQSGMVIEGVNADLPERTGR